ncbi:MAG: hypothetical protein KGI80_05415 [Verrucomicrobiota bacterium]|nr:hypothetical protein [Verrucomicrobiota bacterium]
MMRLIFALLLLGSAAFADNPLPPSPAAVVNLGSPTQTYTVANLYQAWSNRSDYVSVSISGTTLSITAKKAGFASVTYQTRVGSGAQAVVQQNTFGLAIVPTSGDHPSFPTNLMMGARSVLSSTSDSTWWGNGGQSGTEERWTDLIDYYISAGPSSWVYANQMNWQGKPTPGWSPGNYLANFINGAMQQGRIPVVVFYCVVALNQDDTALNNLKNICNANTEVPNYQDYMNQYYNRTIRTLRQVIYTATSSLSWPCLVVIEPDFIAYNMQEGIANPTVSPVTIRGFSGTPQVSICSRNGTEDPVWYPDLWGPNFTTDPLTSVSFPNTLQGFVQSLPTILKGEFTDRVSGDTVQIGSNMKVAWKVNLWASKPGGYAGQMYLPSPPGNEFGVGKGICRWTDVTYNSSASFSTVQQYIVNEAQAIAKVYFDYGITDNADFIAIDRYGIDGGSAPIGAQLYVGYTNPPATIWFWNHDHWNNYNLFLKTVQQTIATEGGTNLPVLMWQIPMGHVNQSTQDFPALANTQGRWEDSAQSYLFGDTFTAQTPTRVDYFSQNQYKDSAVSASGTQITWGSKLSSLTNIGVFGILSAPGVGLANCTYAAQQGGLGLGTAPADGGPYGDSFWWMDNVQNYYQAPLALPSIALFP